MPRLRQEEAGESDGTRTRDPLRDGRRSNQLNLRPALKTTFLRLLCIPLASRPFLKLPESAVTGQPSADNRNSDFLVNQLLKQGLFLRRSRRETNLHRVKIVKRTRASSWH
jgi:hypothetical protein